MFYGATTCIIATTPGLEVVRFHGLTSSDLNKPVVVVKARRALATQGWAWVGRVRSTMRCDDEGLSNIAPRPHITRDLGWLRHVVARVGGLEVAI